MLRLQGSAGAADMAGRLAPLHADSGEQQLSQVPVLALLSDTERQDLAKSFSQCKGESLLSWCMGSSVATAPALDNVTAAMQSMGLVAD